MTERLAIIEVSRERQRFIWPVLAIGMRLVTGPCNAGTCRELSITQSGIVPRPTARARLPSLERFFRCAPFDQRSAIPVAKIHAAGEIEKNFKIAFCLARRLDRLAGNVNRAICVGETTGLFAPQCSWQHDVRNCAVSVMNAS
jgi:hypothetical protein